MPSAPTYQIDVQAGPIYDVTVTSTETAYTVEVVTGPTYQVELQLGTGPAGSAATIALLPPTTLPAGSLATAENVGTPTAAVIQLGIPAGHDGTGTVDSVNGVSPDGTGNVVWKPAAADISDATSTGKAVVTAANAAAARTAIGAGTSNLALGATAATAMPGDKVATDLGGAASNDSRFVGVPVSMQTAAYTLVAGDAGSIVEVNSASAVSVTVPASTFAAGQIVEVCQYGAGQVTIVAGSGVTLRNANGLKISAQYGSASIRFRSATEAVVSGSMTT